MPPRSKQPKTEWHQCSSCDSTISSRDASFHAELCSPDEPLQLNTLNLSTVKHGFFSRKSFVGLLTVFGGTHLHLLYTISVFKQHVLSYLSTCGGARWLCGKGY